MRTGNSDNNNAVPRHLEDDDLIAYMDGEMPRDEQERAGAHLESCWNCRSRLNTVEASIENFLQLRRESLLPKDLPPAGPALEQFRRRLSHHAAQAHDHSIFRRATSQWRAFLSDVTSFLKHGAVRWPGRPVVIRVALALIVSIVIAFLVFRSNHVQTVSANELLQRATDSQAQQLSATAQPVIHQKLQVRHVRANSSAEDSVNWEVWNDTTGARLRQAVDDGRGRRFVSLESDHAAINRSGVETAQPAPATLLELTKVLKANRMDPQRPLSPDSYQSWRNSVGPKQEEVTRSARADGLEVLTLKTVPAGPVGVGGITEVNLSVRARDWHPFEERLRVHVEEGEQEYIFTETAFDVVNLAALDPAIFSPAQIAPTPPPKANPAPGPSPNLAANANAAPLTVPAARPVASAELEREVLDLLNGAGADVSEQVSVNRTPDGLLKVEGIVETAGRKSELLLALSPVANNPAVKIDIQTVAEASERLARQKRQSAPATVDRVEVNKGSLPVEADLRRYFAQDGDRADEQIRQFAARMVNRSQQALFHASALKRLAARFTPAQLSTLDPQTRDKWLSIIRGHASALRRETASLRAELQPIFSPGETGGEGDSDIASDASLVPMIDRLYQLASDNDRAIRAAFTLSTEASAVSAIRTPQFWRSLRSAERLAAIIEKAQ